MQNVSTDFYNLLASNSRDLLDVYEFFDPDETELTPANAALRVASTEVYFDQYQYERQAVSRSDVSRFVDGKFNTVSVTLSNVDRTMSQWIADQESLEGYRVRVRTISRSVPDDSLTLFVGRCEKAYGVGHAQVTINAKQDLGAIENELPPRTLGPRCQVAGGFKQKECLGSNPTVPGITDYSAEYQAAATCNYTLAQCTEYGHQALFQGFVFNNINGNFKVNQRRGGAGGSLLGLVGIGNRRVTKQWSSTQGSAWGTPIPWGFGRTQIEFIPIVYADTGEYLAGQWLIGEGEIQGLANVRAVSAGWARTFQAYAQHMGKYGYDTEQQPAGFFASNEFSHSHTAYIEATILGENPDTGDAAPEIVGVVAWGLNSGNGNYHYYGSSAYDWGDCPAQILFRLLTDIRGLKYAFDWIDGVALGESLDYARGPLLDETGCDDIYVSADGGTPGTDYQRFHSTGLLNTAFFDWVANNGAVEFPFFTQDAEDITTFDPTAPPTVTPTTQYRRRYTCNVHLKAKIKVTDFIFKQLLPSFRGYLKTSAHGKLQICIDRPAPTSPLRSAQVVDDTVLQIEDAKVWLSETLPVRYALVGQGLATSETVKIASIEYSTAGNSIPISVTGATVSSSTLTGGDADTQPSATITLPLASVVTVTVTIDGEVFQYVPTGDDSLATVAAMLDTMINTHPTLSHYIEAEWGRIPGAGSFSNTLHIRSKLGTINLTTPLQEDHDELETVLRIHQPFSSHAFGCLTRGDILRNSFDYPLGSRQSSYNKFSINYTDCPQDFQETELNENDYEHQRRINKTNALTIDGSCVDNFHQADRLVQAARFRYREGDFFCSWDATGVALLLEEGDTVAVHHDQMRGKRNVPLRLEEVKISPDHRVSILGRLYDANQYPETSSSTSIPLMTSVKFYGT